MHIRYWHPGDLTLISGMNRIMPHCCTHYPAALLTKFMPYRVEQRPVLVLQYY